MLGLVATISAVPVMGADVVLAWNPVNRPDLGGYRLHLGTASGRYGKVIDVGNTTQHKLTGLPSGVHFFAVTAYDKNGGHESHHSNEVEFDAPATPVPTPAFSADKRVGTPPLLVNFHNDTVAAAAGWRWDFGDETSSTARDPVKVYGKAGSYSVSLTAISGSSEVTTTRPAFIQVTEPQPLADFSVTLTPTSALPVTASFRDGSAGVVDIRKWTFGDGTSSAEQSPVHAYQAPGTYTVELTVEGPGGRNVKQRVVDIPQPTQGDANRNAALVAAYGFDENSGTMAVDQSGHGNHGVLTAVVRNLGGRYGSGVSLNGTGSQVVVPDSGSLDLTTGMTLEAWVYRTSASTGIVESVICKDQPGSEVFYLNASSIDGIPEQGVFTGAAAPLSGTGAIPPKTWTHLAATYDGSAQRLYINGELASERALSGSISTSNGVLRIGADQWQGYFTGMLDEVRVYNRALSRDEIQADLAQAVRESSPPRRLFGANSVGPVTESVSAGTAVAAKHIAQRNNVVTALNVYLPASGVGTRIVAGLYSDLAGHPYRLLSSGSLAAAKPGVWNAVTVQPVSVKTGTGYWIALRSVGGSLLLTRQADNTGTEFERSTMSTAASLPPYWKASVAERNGPFSAFAAGF